MWGFVALALTPGDPVALQINPSTLLTMTPQQLEQIRQSMGLDGPIYLRYLRWLGGILQGNFGYSLTTGYDVSFEVGARIGPRRSTSWGVRSCSPWLSASHSVSSRPFDSTAGSTMRSQRSALTMISTPTFVLGLIFIFVFGISLHLLPVSGLQTLGAPVSASPIASAT